jgi:hypothetical protein
MVMVPFLRIHRQRVCRDIYIWHLLLCGVPEPKQLGFFDHQSDCEAEAERLCRKFNIAARGQWSGFYHKIRHEKVLARQRRALKRPSPQQRRRLYEHRQRMVEKRQTKEDMRCS